MECKSGQEMPSNSYKLTEMREKCEVGRMKVEKDEKGSGGQ